MRAPLPAVVVRHDPPVHSEVGDPVPLVLRDVAEEDLPILFQHQLDPEATRMAAFPSRDEDAFMTHWRTKVFANPANMRKSIVVDGHVAGNILSWDQDGRRLVGYWIGRDHWGRGVATRALVAFLRLDTTRPLHAWVAEHNVASIRILLKCGFRVDENVGRHTGSDGVTEILMKLDERSP